jgi:hypothetical protein
VGAEATNYIQALDTKSSVFVVRVALELPTRVVDRKGAKRALDKAVSGLTFDACRAP